MKKRLLIAAILLFFAVLLVGTASAGTNNKALSVPKIKVGGNNLSVGTIEIEELSRGDLTSVEDGKLNDGLHDFLIPPRPAGPIYNFNCPAPGIVPALFPAYNCQDGCSGEYYRFTVSLLTPGVSWEYNATAANTPPSWPTVFPFLPAGAPVGLIARQASPANTAPAYFPGVFTGVIGAFIQAAYANVVEIPYYGVAPTWGGLWPSQCYENGHPVAVRNSVDPASGFLSMFDAVVVDMSSTTLTIDVLRSASAGASDAPGIIRIPGGVFRVNTSGIESSSAETAYLDVKVAPAATTNPNLGVSTNEFAIAQLVSADNPGTGGSAQVVADPADPTLREIFACANDQQASNIVITEQVDDQLSNGSFTVSAPNGVEFTRAPDVSWDQNKGLQAVLTTTAYPTQTITIEVIGNTPKSGPGTIRISNIHFNVACTVEPGQLMIDIAPVINPGGGGGQDLNGLDDTSIALGYVVTSVVVGEEGAASIVKNVSVSGSGGCITLNLDVSPPTTVTGKLWIELVVDPLFADILWVRPRNDAVPTVDGLYVVLAEQDGAEVFNVDELWYKSGSLSSSAAPATFFICGLTEDVVGETITVKSSYSTDGFDGRSTIQTVTIILVP